MWRCCLIVLLSLAGCRQAEPPAPVAVVDSLTKEEWYPRYCELTNAVQPGMTKDEVAKVAGSPQRTRSSIGGTTALRWEFLLGSNAFFEVWFDHSNRVARAELLSGVKTIR